MGDRFRGKVVVVTGASSGVGRAIVRAFAHEGANLGLIARNETALEAAAAEVRSAGGRALVLPLDVSDAEAVDQAASKVEDTLGPINLWINDAMVTVFAPFTELTPEEFKRVTEVTYLGYVYGTMSALKRMLPRDAGGILQIGSALAYRSIPLQSAYCGGKAAIRGFTDSIRSELIHDRSNVNISMLQLPAVNTPQFDIQRTKLPRHPQPVPPIYQPEVIADAALYVAENWPREMVIAGSTLKAILGQKLVPGFVDRYLARNGFASQMTAEPVDPHRPDNLFEPVPGDHGAHGSFDRQAQTFSPELAARMHMPALAAAAASAIVAAGALTASLKRHH